MKKNLRFLLALFLACIGVTAARADEQELVLREKLLYKTDFQEWDDVKANTTAPVKVTKTLTDGNTVTFSLYNTAVDNDGMNDKFTGDDVTPGYLQTQKNTTYVAYIETSAIADLTRFELYQAATGGTRGVTVSVKGDGDADWVMLHNKSIVQGAGEWLTFAPNRKNCQIRIGTFNPEQNAYILSLRLYGNVLVPARKFVDFAIDLTTNPYHVTQPADGQLPEGVVVNGGTFHDLQHGYTAFNISVPVDGPVKVTAGGCNFTNQATVSIDGQVVGTLNTNAAKCGGVATYIYNKAQAATLTIDCGNYCPSLKVEACDLIPECTVTYYDTDNKTVIGTEVVEGSSKLAFKYGASDVTVGEGKKFRGWYNGKVSTSLKVKEGVEIVEDLRLYAKATDIETVTDHSHFRYDLNKPNFYIEDHEAIEAFGSSTYHDGTHGWSTGKDSGFKLKVGGKAYITIYNCFYPQPEAGHPLSEVAGEGILTDEAGQTVGSFTTPAESDGAAVTIKYDGPATTLTLTYTATAYVHAIEVACVRDFIVFDETSRYYFIPANDVNSFLLALKDANSKNNVRIFLPNGTYDLGETALTSISGKNISIIGESMTGTIIKNAPLVENEGIGTTATLLNNATNLYLQDLTIQNALDYYKSGAAGRAVCLQDKGNKTICKNVRMLSYQDTYYSNEAAKYYWEDSEIHGTVDYLCGDGDVIYNRCTFVNESRKANVEDGDCTVCAPYHSASCKWGYVFLDCTIDTRSKTFNLGRSWGGESKAVYIRTTLLQPNKLVSSRFTIDGMNSAAYGFYEYGTMNANGQNITPASHVVKFTHSSGNHQYETILTDSKAAEYTVANIFGEWAPDDIAAQCVITDEVVSAGNYESIADFYLAQIDGVLSIIPAADVKTAIQDKADVTLRAANARGGFGPAKVIRSASGIKTAYVQQKSGIAYDLYGRVVNNASNGIYIIDGVKVRM